MADELARLGHFGAIEYQAVKDARLQWKKRESQDAFRHYEQVLVNLVDQAITSLSIEDLTSASQVVINEYKDQVYTYTRSLITELRANGYLLFVISASQQEIVGMLAEHYGFDGFAGSSYETQGGKFTGKKEVLVSERKPTALKRLAHEHGATYEGSIAVGDSESDIPMLEAVEQPIAFNPTKLLFDHAKEQSWKIVVERKNVIYELEPRNGSYSLKT